MCNCLCGYLQVPLEVNKEVKLDPLELELWVNICESRKMNPHALQEQYLLLTFEPSPLQPQAVIVW